MKQNGYPDLEDYATTILKAERYPNDYHLFKLYGCDDCGVVPFELIIEHHTGSREGDFKGKIVGSCTKCSGNKLLFSFTGNQRKKVQDEKPLCECENEGFIVGECERIEGDEGLLGFFDEGVVVGKCAGCGINQVLVMTD
jgi:hypothetical protein